jgi:hypothetical protein
LESGHLEDLEETIIVPVVSCDCEMSLIPREEHKLQVSGNEVVRKMFRPKKDKYVGNQGYYMMRNFIIYTGHIVLLE